MLEQVRTYIAREGMLRRGETVIVAVSGGPDSVALLHLLHRLSGEFGVRLHVFHMDHGLRGEASAADARYVRDLAGTLGLPVTVVALPPGELKAMSGSLQANARARRYEEMRRLARQIGAQRAALGHNRDDQAETVLMRLLRGAGTAGLAGIPPVRLEEGLTYIRPLLGIPRREILLYCQEHELHFRLDASNERLEYLRNRIRLELLPYLEREYSPALSRHLAETAAILRDEDALLDSLAAEVLRRCRLPGEGAALQAEALLKEPVALVRRVLRLAAREVAGPAYDLGFGPTGEILRLLAENSGTRQLHLPGGLALLAEYGTVRFLRREDGSGAVGDHHWLLPEQGDLDLPELGLQVRVRPEPVEAGPWSATFDADLLPGPLAIRFRRPGDRIWPVGMRGSKKLQDLLVDAKVPRRLRDRIPLLVAGKEVLWVIGHRLDRRFLADGSSRRAVGISVLQFRSDGA